MKQERVYYLSSQEPAVAPPTLISAVEDDDAVRQATALRDDCDIEIWEGKQLVRRLPLRPPRIYSLRTALPLHISFVQRKRRHPA